MSPWVVVALLIVAGGGSSKKKGGAGGAGGGAGGAEVPPDDGGGLNPQAQCPEGSPVLYDGVPVYGDIREDDLKLLTFAEQEALEEVLTDIVADKGYPQPGPGLCTFELLSKAMEVNTWRGVLTMLILWRANPYTKGKSFSKLNAAQKERFAIIAEAVVRHEEPSSDADDAAAEDPGGNAVIVTKVPTPGAYYRVVKGDTVLALAGAASGFPPASAKRLAYAKKVNTHDLNRHAMVVAKLGSFDMKYLGGYTAQLVPTYDEADLQAKPGSGDAYPALYFPPVDP